LVDFGNQNDPIKNMILKISLDNPKEYEEIALNQALKFIKDKFDWINTINEEEAIYFLENYCID